MTLRQSISTSISRVTISVVLLLVSIATADAQKLFRLEKDSIPIMRGFQVSFDLVGAAQMAFGDYGQYEAALHLNLHDQWFPIVELGYGRANHENDEVTLVDPYWRYPAEYSIRDEQCSQKWLEFVFGVDAQLFGPLHLGWSVRYKARLAHDEGNAGNSWYVPGYGTQDNTKLGGTFNVIIDI